MNFNQNYLFPNNLDSVGCAKFPKTGIITSGHYPHFPFHMYFCRVFTLNHKKSSKGRLSDYMMLVGGLQPLNITTETFGASGLFCV